MKLFRSPIASRLLFLFTTMWFVVFLSGCTTAWTSEATNIIALLVPSITSILGILSAFGVGLPASAMTAVQTWAAQATTALQTVKTLIDQYNTAEEGAKPGILTEIQTALSVIVSNLSSILPQIRVSDSATQAKILAVIQDFQLELTALLNLVPAIQGQVQSHEQLKALVAELKTPKEFKKAFNTAVEPFGDTYKI